ncbi:MAG: T9SS type A sorting domain-containing protein, partial [Bacteroidota bacterium]|nr:T9SS type A sorting domain-containing protein [Bacteroidota bacterium]
PLVDTIRHWVNIYEVDASYVPINKNSGIDLTRYTVNAGILQVGNTYQWRVRYRDHNCRWSEWSDAKSFTIKDQVDDVPILTEDGVRFYPNPASAFINVKGEGILRVDLLTLQGCCVKQYDVKNGNPFVIDLIGISPGIYFLKIVTNKEDIVRKLIVNK